MPKSKYNWHIEISALASLFLVFFCLFVCLFVSFLGHTVWHVGFVSQPGMEPTRPAMEVQSLNHWTPGKSQTSFFCCLFVCFLKSTRGSCV